MKLHLNSRGDAWLVRACALDATHRPPRYRIKVADAWHERSVILTPAGVELWGVADAAALCLADFQRLAALGSEVLILGTGQRALFPPAAITQPLMQKRIGLEVMDTSAACRTYNILTADGRNAAAALIV